MDQLSTIFAKQLEPLLQMTLQGVLERVAKDYGLDEGELVEKYLGEGVAKGVEKKAPRKRAPKKVVERKPCPCFTKQGCPCKNKCLEGETTCKAHQGKTPEETKPVPKKAPTKKTKKSKKSKKGKEPKHSHAPGEGGEDCEVCEHGGDPLKMEGPDDDILLQSMKEMLDIDVDDIANMMKGGIEEEEELDIPNNQGEEIEV
jgi:hypothetical protein